MLNVLSGLKKVKNEVYIFLTHLLYGWIQLFTKTSILFAFDRNSYLIVIPAKAGIHDRRCGFPPSRE